MCEAGGHGFRVRHLRHPLGMDEAGRLDVANARADESLDQRQLVARRDGLRLVLQAIASGYIDDFYFFTHDPGTALTPRRAALFFLNCTA